MDAATPSEQQALYTCLSCSIAFPSAEDQRMHYRSDHHRYNMKRRVANLPPVSAAMFNQKVLDRRQETSIMASARGSVCEVCNKTYTTENAYRSHIASKKHKENEVKASQKLKDAPIASDSSSDDEVPSADIGQTTVPESSSNAEPPQKVVATSSQGVTLTVNEDATEEEVTQTIDEKIAAARSRLSPKHCLFCSNVLPSLEANLTHMSTAHSFFIPDADYLTDLEGLITYLGEKIAIGNVCLFCNTRSREFRTMDAVRKHMVDKSHCKIAYDSQNDRLEISDYYDFSSSYPVQARKSKSKSKSKKSTPKLPAGEDAEEWEDVDDDGEEADEVVDGVPSSEDEDDSDDEDASDSDESLFEEELTYGDTPYELVLPSGARIGHRTMKRYYQQSFPKSALVLKDGSEDANSGAALVRRLLADKNSALIPRKGGFGAYGIGTEVVKARNRGEAREAGRHVREFRDQKRREDFKTRVGFISNHQKHFRDPLLQ